jgi:hypothetical protein
MEIDPATQSARDVLHRLDLNPILYAAGVSPDLLKPQQYLCLRRIAADISPNAKAQLAKINTHALWEQATSMAGCTWHLQSLGTRLRLQSRCGKLGGVPIH